LDFLTQHSTVITMVAYMVFSAAVSSLPPPKTNAGTFYEWMYKFANTLSANVTAIRGKAAFDSSPNQQPPVPPA